MTRLKSLIAIVLASLVFVVPCFAQADEPLNETFYHLFNPVPEDQMRELSTDRPDKTESPISVDAGHIQVEADIVTHTFDHDSPGVEDESSRTFGFAVPNIKFGLLDNVDLQIIPQSYVYQRTSNRETKAHATQNGFGDLVTRLKVNFWGNDGESTSLGIIPFIKFATNYKDLGNNDLEGGVILPYGIELPSDWWVYAMHEIDFNSNDDDNSYHRSFINSVTFGHAIVGDLAGYAELWTLVPSNDADHWQATVDFGLTYLYSRFVQLDIGINTGVTQSADDANMFVGYTIKR